MGFEAAMERVAEIMPKINPVIGEGITYHQMKNVESAIDQLMKVAFRSSDCPRLPSGFNYVDYDVLSPAETFKFKMDRAKNKSTAWFTPFDMARTDTYIVKYNFDNNGQIFHVYLAIPFISKGNIITLRGVAYTASPVIKSKGVSVTSNGYFVEFNANKVTFTQLPTTMVLDGKLRHVAIPFTDKLYQRKKSHGKKSFRPALAFWLFTKYGIKGTFQKYLNVNVDIISSDDSDELTTFRRSAEYVVLEHHSSIKHNHVGDKKPFVIVMKRGDYSTSAEVLIASIFYAADTQYDIMSHEYLDEPDTWKLLLGYANMGRGRLAQCIISDVNNHLFQQESYLDGIFKAELTSVGIFVDTIFDFYFYLIDRMTNSKMDDHLNVGNLWGRYYVSIEYLTYDIRNRVNMARWNLQNGASNSNTGELGRPMSTASIRTAIISKNLFTDIIQDIKKTTHSEVNVLMTTTDSYLLSSSAKCIEQASSRKQPNTGGGPKQIDLNDRSRLLHASDLTHGSVLNLQNSDPLSSNNMNPFGTIDPFGKIYLSEKLKPIANQLNMDFSRKGG